MSLSGDKRLLKRQNEELNKTDNDANTFNKRIDKLIDAIQDDIQSDMLDALVDAANDFYDRPVAGSYDSDINGAKSKITQEIKTIEAAIEARRRAAEALEKASPGR